MVENIWQLDQQIKQVFDVDAYNNGIDINDIKSKIKELFPNKPKITLNEHQENIKEK